MQGNPFSLRAAKMKWLVIIISLFSLLAPFSASPAFAASSTSNNSENCPQPSLNKDPDTLTSREIALYGLFPHFKGENHAKWRSLTLAAKHRFCTVTPTSNKNSFQPWAGNIGDQGGYTLASVAWNVPCIAAGSQTGKSSHWVGIGGVGNNNLVQTGTASQIYNVLGIQYYVYYAWVENLAASNPNEQQVFSVNCGDHIFAEVYGGNNMYIQDFTSGNYTTQTYGPKANSSTFECIAEDPNNGTQSLADFRYVNFTGCYANGNGVGQGPHYYLNVTKNGHILTSVGPISNYGNYTVTWKGYD